jgi:hypothetical protein
MKWAMLGLLGCLTLAILWFERCYLFKQYCQPTHIISLPPPPYIYFNYALVNMESWKANQLVTSLNGGTSIDTVAHNPPFANVGCLYQADASTMLQRPEFTGTALGSAHSPLRFWFHVLPAPANPTQCQNTLLPISMILLAYPQTLHTPTALGSVDMRLSNLVEAFANTTSTPPCGFFQFTASQLDFNADGSVKDFTGDFRFLLRDDVDTNCNNTGSGTANVVVVTGGGVGL